MASLDQTHLRRSLEKAYLLQRFNDAVPQYAVRQGTSTCFAYICVTLINVPLANVSATHFIRTLLATALLFTLSILGCMPHMYVCLLWASRKYKLGAAVSPSWKWFLNNNLLNCQYTTAVMVVQPKTKYTQEGNTTISMKTMIYMYNIYI